MATYIVYPRRGWIAAETIATLYTDAVADNLIAPEYLNAKTEFEQAAALCDIGWITTAMPPPPDEEKIPA